MSKKNRRKRQSPNYEVGYGKPPRKHRFKRGLSGNPKGRPRKEDPDLWSLIEQELRRTIEVAADGQRQLLTIKQVIVKKLINDAAAGTPAERREALKAIQKLQVERKAEERAFQFPIVLEARDVDL